MLKNIRGKASSPINIKRLGYDKHIFRFCSPLPCSVGLGQGSALVLVNEIYPYIFILQHRRARGGLVLIHPFYIQPVIDAEGLQLEKSYEKNPKQT